MATLSTIRTRVQSHWPTNYHSSYLTDAKTNEYINAIQREICRSFNFSWLKQEVEQDTVDEQRKYALPTAGDANWTEVEGGTVRLYKDEVALDLVNVNNASVNLTKMHKKDIENEPRWSDLDDKGTPSVYAIEQGYIWFFDKPSHEANSNSAWTISLEFYGYLADLSADDDTNEITNKYPKVLEFGAAAEGLRYGKDFEEAEYWEGKAADIVAQMLREDMIEEYGTIEVGLRPAPGQKLGA